MSGNFVKTLASELAQVIATEFPNLFRQIPSAQDNAVENTQEICHNNNKNQVHTSNGIQGDCQDKEPEVTDNNVNINEIGRCSNNEGTSEINDMEWSEPRNTAKRSSPTNNEDAMITTNMLPVIENYGEEFPAIEENNTPKTKKNIKANKGSLKAKNTSDTEIHADNNLPQGNSTELKHTENNKDNTDIAGDNKIQDNSISGKNTTEGRGCFQFPQKSSKIPSVIIKDTTKPWKQLSKMLEENDLKEFTAKMVKEDHYVIKVKDALSYRKLTHFLDQHMIKFHTYLLPTEKDMKVVIRSLPKDTPVTNIQDALVEEGYSFLYKGVSFL